MATLTLQQQQQQPLTVEPALKRQRVKSPPQLIAPRPEPPCAPPVPASVECQQPVKFQKALEQRHLTEYHDLLLHVQQRLLDQQHRLRQVLRGRPHAHWESKIFPCMRPRLVSWLVRMAQEEEMHVSVVYNAFSYIESYAIARHFDTSAGAKITPRRFHVVSAAAMELAIKMQAVWAIPIDVMCEYADYTFEPQDLIDMEWTMLQHLDYCLSTATAQQFIEVYADTFALCAKTRTLAEYIGLLSLQCADFSLRYLPSQVAKSALFLAMYTLLDGPVPDEHLAAYRFFIRDPQAGASDCVSRLHGFLDRASRDVLLYDVCFYYRRDSQQGVANLPMVSLDNMINFAYVLDLLNGDDK